MEDEQQSDEERAHSAFYSYGWRDYVDSEDSQLYVGWLREGRGSGAIWKMPQELVEQWYVEGWNAAQQAEQEQGRAVFLLHELLKRMDAGDEWYGTDFDVPMRLVRAVLAEIQPRDTMKGE